MEKESADRQERTMGVQACIPTNKQSDGGEERGEKRGGSLRNRNLKVNIREVGSRGAAGGGACCVLQQKELEIKRKRKETCWEKKER